MICKSILVDGCVFVGLFNVPLVAHRWWMGRSSLAETGGAAFGKAVPARFLRRMLVIYRNLIGIDLKAGPWLGIAS